MKEIVGDQEVVGTGGILNKAIEAMTWTQVTWYSQYYLTAASELSLEFFSSGQKAGQSQVLSDWAEGFSDFSLHFFSFGPPLLFFVSCLGCSEKGSHLSFSWSLSTVCMQTGRCPPCHPFWESAVWKHENIAVLPLEEKNLNKTEGNVKDKVVCFMLYIWRRSQVVNLETNIDFLPKIFPP